jgi:hypothetical protein
VTSPDASIPDLKKRSKLLYVILGVGALAVVAVIIVVATGGKKFEDPGKDACARIEQQAEMGPEQWDWFIDQLVTYVKKNVKTQQGEMITIQSNKRPDVCSELMRKLDKAMGSEKFAPVAKCIADITNAKQGMRCVELLH